MPFFSVIIPTYNRSVLLKRAIDSVLNQNFKDFELFVIDDGSTDDTQETIKKYSGKLFYLKQKNSGVSAARNLGIKKCNGEYITFLDSDDSWLPEKLYEHFNFIKKNPHVRIHQTDELWLRKGKKVNKKEKHKKKEGPIFIDSLKLCLISPSAVAMDCSLFNEYGYFDESMQACEDYDLWLRISSKEFIGFIDKKLIVKHGGHEDQLSYKYWGMDSFRIYSIIKLLGDSNIILPEQYKVESKKIAIEKFKILLTGSKKRGRSGYADELIKMINMFKNGCYNKKYYSTLLKK